MAKNAGCPIKDKNWRNFVDYFKKQGLSEKDSEIEAYREHLAFNGILRNPKDAYIDYMERNENVSTEEYIRDIKNLVIREVLKGNPISDELIELSDILSYTDTFTGGLVRKKSINYQEIVKSERDRIVSFNIDRMKTHKLIHSFNGELYITKNNYNKFTQDKTKLTSTEIVAQFRNNCAYYQINPAVVKFEVTKNGVKVVPNIVNIEQLIPYSASELQYITPSQVEVIENTKEVYEQESKDGVVWVNGVVEKDPKGIYGEIKPQKTDGSRQTVSNNNEKVDRQGGRNLKSNEIESIFPGSIKRLYTTSDRKEINDKMSLFAEEYGVELIHTEENNSYDTPNWFCSDTNFLAFLKFYSSGSDGLYHGSVRQWEIFKAMISDTVTDNVTHDDIDFAKSEYSDIVQERREEFDAFVKQYNIEESKADAIRDIYSNPILLENNSLNDEELALLNTVSQSIDTFKRFYPSVFDIAETMMNNANIDNIPTDELEEKESIDFCQRLSENLGIDYEMISEEEAIELLKDTATPFDSSRDTGFFYNGKVYFIKGKINKDLILHEFAHPFIAAIALKNKKLFNDLYARLNATQEGRKIINDIKQLYPELDETSDEFIEECIVTAIERSRELENKTKSFKDYIKDFFYVLKQMLRSLCKSRINISNLSSNTTLGELRQMMLSDSKFDIEKSSVSRNDIAKFKRNVSQMRSEIDNFYSKKDASGNIDPTTIEINKLNNNMDTIFKFLMDYQKLIETNDDFISLNKIDLDKFGNSEFSQIIKEMSRITNLYVNDHNKFSSVINEFQKKANAFCRELYVVNDIANNIFDIVGKLNKDNLSQSDVHMLYSYNNMINHWLNFYDEFTKEMNNEMASLPQASQLTSIVSNIKIKLTNAKNQIDDVYLDIASDVIYDNLLPIYDKFEETFNIRINAAQNASQEVRDTIFEEYYGMGEKEFTKFTSLLRIYMQNPKRPNFIGNDKEKFNELLNKSRKGLIRTKDQIKLTIKGEMGDADYLNTKMEGYLYSTDPVIGGFALFHKKQMEAAHQRALGRYFKLVEDIDPILKRMGLNKIKIGELGKKVLFLDKVLSKDENGNYVESYVWTFKNPFKNYRYELEKLENELTDAETAYKSATNQTEKDSAKARYREAKMKLDTFKMSYMNQKYSSEYYRDNMIIENEHAVINGVDVWYGHNVMEKRNSIMMDIELLRDELNDNANTVDDIDENERILFQIDSLQKELAMLSSLKDEYGNDKTGVDLLEAQALREHNKRMSKYYKSETDTAQFEKNYIKFRNALLNSGLSENSVEFNTRMDKWMKRNMQYGLSPSVKAEVERLKEKIASLTITNPQKKAIYDKINSIVSVYRDSYGEVDVSKIPSSAMNEIKRLQEEANKIQGSKQSNELRRLYSRLNSLVKKAPTDIYLNQLQSLIELYNITDADMLSEFNSSNIDELAEFITGQDFDPNTISSKYPLLYKWFMDNHAEKTVRVFTQQGYLHLTSYDRLNCYSKEVAVDPANDIHYQIIDLATGVVIANLRGKPGKVYSRSVIDDAYVTKKEVGVTVDNRNQWLPKSKSAVASDPNLSDNPNDDNYRYKFINEEYDSLDPDSDERKLIDALVANHLSVQDSGSVRNRLYLDAPRFRSETSEILAQASDNGLKETFSTFIRRCKMFIQGAPDDYENGIGDFDPNTSLIKLDTLDDNFSKIPANGLSKLDYKDVSTNILRSMMRYAESIEREKAMRDASPVANAIQQSLNNQDNGIKTNKYDRDRFRISGVFSRVSQSDNFRKDAINNLIEREYQGVNVKGFGSQNKLLMNTINKLMGLASFSFFGMNIPSALKNSYGIKFQALIEGTARQHMNNRSLEKGNRWALKHMTMESLGGFYNMSDGKTKERQIVELFDMAQDNASDTFMDPMWRSLGTDILDMKPLYMPRKWVEQQATYQVGAGILYFNKVAVRTESGEVKFIPYMDAFDLTNGILDTDSTLDVRYRITDTKYIPQPGDTEQSLIEKFNIHDSNTSSDPNLNEFRSKRYLERVLKGRTVQEILTDIANEERKYRSELYNANIKYTGEELNNHIMLIEAEHQRALERNTLIFKNEGYQSIKNNIHQVNNDLGGAYAKFDQPDFQRYFLYKLTMFLRRYFVPMFLKRYRTGNRINPGLGTNTQGFYVQSILLLKKAIQTRGEYIKYATSQEKASLVRFGTEMLLLQAVPLLLLFAFGYDDDDDDRYKKLRKKSAALSTPFSQDDPTRKFNMAGFLELHGMHLLMQVRAENEQFQPFMGGIKGLSSMTDIKSVMFGPTIDVWTQILDDVFKMATDDPAAYYSRNIGPYKWQQKESPKIINHSIKMLGLTGTSLDPALAIQNFEANASKVRR